MAFFHFSLFFCCLLAVPYCITGTAPNTGSKSKSDKEELVLLEKLLDQEDNLKEEKSVPSDIINRIKQFLTDPTLNETEEVVSEEFRSVCLSDEFRCRDSPLCIPARWQCDGIVDCMDESDEISCFECVHDVRGQLIPQSKVCDGESDCSDGEDERKCKFPCEYSEFQCDPFDLNSACIPSDWTCDRYVDCPGFTDELVNLCGPIYLRCKSTDFVCAHEQFCIPSSWRCDESNDCFDNSDEMGCDVPISLLDDDTPISKSLWDGWGDWSKCSSSCDGEQIRMRRCQSGICVGDFSDIKPCGKQYPCVLEPTSGCGTRTFSPPTGRVVGGIDAQPNEWPWQVQIFRKMKTLPFCGGSLIERKWVLTAAHCFLMKRCIATKCYAAIGRQHTSRYITDKEAIEIPIKRIIIHEGYEKWSHKNDIALAELETDVPHSVSANLVCLPGEDDDLSQFSPEDQPDCYVTGFGLNEIGKRPIVMQEAHVPLIDHGICSAPHVYGSLVSQLMICAGHLEGGIDACQGDSGGPLVCQSRKDGRWYQLGLTSWGKGCGLPNRPGVYTRMTKYVEWISNQMGSGGR